MIRRRLHRRPRSSWAEGERTGTELGHLQVCQVVKMVGPGNLGTDASFVVAQGAV
jgi:hypothetical protein